MLLSVLNEPRLARRFRHLGSGSVPLHHSLTEHIRLAKPRWVHHSTGGIMTS